MSVDGSSISVFSTLDLQENKIRIMQKNKKLDFMIISVLLLSKIYSKKTFNISLIRIDLINNYILFFWIVFIPKAF